MAGPFLVEGTYSFLKGAGACPLREGAFSCKIPSECRGSRWEISIRKRQRGKRDREREEGGGGIEQKFRVTDVGLNMHQERLNHP
jgi:hypothetical protein